MAVQLWRFYSSPLEGSYAEWQWDDQALTLTGINIFCPLTAANPMMLRTDPGGAPIAKDGQGNSAWQSFPLGTNGVYKFPTPLPVTLGTDSRGRPNWSCGYSEICAGHFSAALPIATSILIAPIAAVTT